MYVRLSLGQPEDLDQGSDFLELWVTGDYRPLELLCQCCRKSISIGNSVVGLESSGSQHPWPINGLLVYGQLINERQCGNRNIPTTLALGNGAAPLKRPLRRLGYELTAMSDAVPSILAYTQEVSGRVGKRAVRLFSKL